VDSWLAGPAKVLTNTVHASYNSFVPGVKGKPWPGSAVGAFLKEMVPDLDKVCRRNSGVRENCYLLPSLSILRARFTEKYGVEFAPHKDDEDDADRIKELHVAQAAAAMRRML
jgi:hypothetical protein